METLNLKKEISAAYKKSNNWFAQAGNVVYSIAWIIGTWVMITTVIVGALAIIFMLNISEADMSQATHPGFQSGLKMTVMFVSAATVFFIAVFGLPKRLRNIFLEVAQDRVARHSAIMREITDQVDTAEALLLSHKLISEDDILKRKSDLPDGRVL